MGNGQGKRDIAARAAPANQANGGGGGPGNAIVGATQKMKSTITNLEKRRKFLELRAQKARKEALVYKKQGNKKQALMALKRSKLFSKEVERVDSQMFNLERQQINLEAGSTTQTVFQTMQTGLNAQRRIARQIDVEAVQDAVDQQAEYTDNLEEVQEVLGQDWAETEADDELLAELNDLEADDVENRAFVDVPARPAETVPELPDAPTQTPTPLPEVPNTPVKVEPVKKPVLAGSDEAAFAELEAELL